MTEHANDQTTWGNGNPKPAVFGKADSGMADPNFNTEWGETSSNTRKIHRVIDDVLKNEYKCPNCDFVSGSQDILARHAEQEAKAPITKKDLRDMAQAITTGISEAFHGLAQTLQSGKAQPKKAPPAKECCANCGKTSKLAAKGLCVKCYQKQRREKNVSGSAELPGGTGAAGPESSAPVGPQTLPLEHPPQKPE